MAVFPNGWSWCKRIDLPIPDANLVDFPAKVPIVAGSPASIAIGAHCLANGHDIRFTAADGVTEFPYEREVFSGGGGAPLTAIIWVKSNVSTAGTYVWIYYGRADAADGENATAVWDANYKAVYHMKDLTTSTIKDSTANANNGTKTAANEPIEATGKVGQGQDFDGANDYIRIADNVGMNGLFAKYSFSGWIRIDGGTATYRCITEFGDAVTIGAHIYVSDASKLYVSFRNQAGQSQAVLGTTILSPGAWYRVAFSYDSVAGTGVIYLNGEVEKTVTGLTGNLDARLGTYLGIRQASLLPFNGMEDEARYSPSIARSAAWIKYEYANMNPADGGLTWGAEELAPTYANLIASPACQRDLLLRITPKEQLRGWTKTAGYSYTYEIAWNDLPSMGTYGLTYRALQSVEHNGAALALRASIATIDAAAGGYYYDAMAKKLYVRCTDDGAADRESVYVVAFFRLHFASGLGKAARGKIFNGIYYEPLFDASALSAIQSEESDFLTGGGLACGDLALELLNSKRFFDYVWTIWSWRNAAVEILHGGEDLPLSEYATIYAGYVKDESWRGDKVRLDTVNWLELLSRQVPVNPCFGDGVSEDARGKPLPLLFGRVTEIQPLCTNTVPAAGTEWTIADADYQTLKEIEAVYDGASLVSPSSYTVDLANCKFTFVGYAPAGDVTCTAKGAKISDIPGESSTDLMTNASDIIRFFLLAVLGLSSSQINTTAFAAAKTSLTEYVLGKYIRNRKNLSTYINEIERSVLGIVYQENDGRISFDAFSPFYTADATIETQEIAEFEQNAPSDKLYAGVQVYYDPTPATADQLGLDAVGDDDAFAVVEGTNLRARYVDGEETAYKRLYTWLTDADSAEFLKQRVLYLTNIPMVELTMTINGLKLFTAKPSDILKINKALAPGPTGSLVDQYFQIISISKELSSAQCELVVDNFKGGAAQVGIWCSDMAPAWASATDAEKGTQGFWCDDDGLVVPGDWTTCNRSVFW